ncbi:MAG: ATP-binding protein [Pseudomonadota bacterium]
MPEASERAPASLLVRTNLVLGVAALLIALSAGFALYIFVISPISAQSAEDEAALLVLSAQTWVELPPDARPYFELEMAENHDLIISEVLEELPIIGNPSAYFEVLKTSLSERVEAPVELLAGNDLYWVQVPMGGVQLQIGFAPERSEIQPLYSAIFIVVLGAGIVFFASLFIVQRIARPLVRVAAQAEHFRGTQQIEPLPESGPRELASLARNFNTMAGEISALLENRTTLLAGISHDLRTPLARMRLALALLPDNVDPALTARFERNLEAMDQLVSDVLRFARGTGETPAEVDLGPFVREIVNSFDGEVRARIDLEGEQGRAVVAVNALRRVVVNLVENGIQHGDSVDVVVEPGVIRIIDDGPGIPEDYRVQVFQPFFRLERSRNRATGGSGLGLAIVAQLCQAQGWAVSLDAGPKGGTEVKIALEGGG